MIAAIRRLLLVVTILVTPLAHAHKVNLFAFPEGDDIFVEGYFMDGKKPMGSEITVYDSSGAQLLSGKTNDDGQFRFPIPKREELRIVLNAGEGHQAEYLVTREELAGIEGGDETAAASGSASPPGTTPATAADGNVSQAMVRKAVGEAIIPLMRSLSELKEQRGFSDIVGGIGFIFGVIGVFFYLKARRMMAK